MTQYAAAAGKAPLTLLESGDKVGLSGILFGKEAEKCCFRDMEKLVDEVGRLIKDTDYREIKAAQLEKAIISPETFRHNLAKICTEAKSDYPIDFLDTNL